MFVSAYANVYNPAVNGLVMNWLGDTGTAGNSNAGSDPLFFQVTVPLGDSLVVVVNTTSSAGLGETFRLNGEYFADTQFTDPAVVPEPSTYALLLGAGLVLLGTLRTHGRGVLGQGQSRAA